MCRSTVRTPSHHKDCIAGPSGSPTRPIKTAGTLENEVVSVAPPIVRISSQPKRKSTNGEAMICAYALKAYMD